MKKIVTLLITLVVLTGCKTTEANYRAAYEVAKNKKEKASEAMPEGVVLQKYDLPKLMIIEGDSLMVLRSYVGKVKEENMTSGGLKKFNIVVGEFKQVFNAKQMMSRLKEKGYSGAGVLETNRKDYYVVADQLDTAKETKDVLGKVMSDTSLIMREPLPFVLIPANFRL
ncbi:MAG: hypothetical protein J1E38_09110 [Paramuribaculum sp.]|nr:hypothetical protein [Paramuribaculum sp.]